jgi:glycosyltransferase involved in cell wall biosynthesis
MSPRLSAVVCSLNGADGVARCLTALAAQTIGPDLELIVVDDGSTDGTSEAARAGGAVVVRHPSRRGISAARNSGIEVASSPVIAFLDDDCEPAPRWAETLLASYDENVVAVGGPVIPASSARPLSGYLTRHNPIVPQEIELTRSNGPGYRLWLYLRRQWSAAERDGRRPVATMPSANMSVRESALHAVGGFDERILFGSEDEDLCRRLARAYPAMRLVFEPEAMVIHHFKATVRDAMRRRRAYGHGSAIMYRKWPEIRPTVFPFPVAIASMLIASAWFPLLLPITILTPHVCYPSGLRAAVGKRRPACILDAYVQLLEEACDNFGFVEGLWRFRGFAAESPALPLAPPPAESKP